MHDLLRELRYNAPAKITSTQDHGQFMYVGLRYENLDAGLLVRKRSPLTSEDLALVHPGPAIPITGATAEERVRNLLTCLQNRPAPRT